MNKKELQNLPTVPARLAVHPTSERTISTVILDDQRVIQDLRFENETLRAQLEQLHGLLTNALLVFHGVPLSRENASRDRSRRMLACYQAFSRIFPQVLPLLPLASFSATDAPELLAQDVAWLRALFQMFEPPARRPPA